MTWTWGTPETVWCVIQVLDDVDLSFFVVFVALDVILLDFDYLAEGIHAESVVNAEDDQDDADSYLLPGLRSEIVLRKVHASSKCKASEESEHVWQDGEMFFLQRLSILMTADSCDRMKTHVFEAADQQNVNQSDERKYAEQNSAMDKPWLPENRFKIDGKKKVEFSAGDNPLHVHRHQPKQREKGERQWTHRSQPSEEFSQTL